MAQEKQPDVSQEEYFVWTGKIMHAASMADFWMFGAFAIMSGAKTEVARAIYFSLDAISAKEKITRKVAQAIKCTLNEMECVNEIIEQARKANNQRNEFSHALLAQDTEKGTLNKLRMKVVEWEGVQQPLTREYLSLKLSLAETALNAAAEQVSRLVQLLRLRLQPGIPADVAASLKEADRRSDPEPLPATPDQKPEEPPG